MNTFDQKILAVGRLLALRDFSSLNVLEEFSDEEILVLTLKLNVRFSHSSSGFKCFFSSKIGKAGIAENKVKAFTFMLDNFHFRPDLNEEGFLWLS